MNDPLLEHLKVLEEQSTPKRLLLVDDTPKDCEAIRLWTREFKCDWFVAGSPDAALQTLVDKDQDFFTIIVMDLCMPTPSHGLELFRKIALNYPDIPVVVLSGYLSWEAIAAFSSIDQIVFFVQKPQSFNGRYFAKMFRLMGIPRKADIPDRQNVCS